jgi:hypothetical protein
MPEFFESRRLRYEIHKLADKRWQIADIVEDGREQRAMFGRSDFEELEKNVLGKANALLSGNEIKAVRVMRERIRADGFITTSEIFFKEATNGKAEAPVTVSRYDGEVPLCKTNEDLFSRESCRVIGAVLRIFLDKQFITALELLHFQPYIRKLNENYALVQGGIHQIAAIQAKIGGVDQKSRAEALHGFIDAAERRAREAFGDKSLPTIVNGKFREFAEALASHHQGEARRYYARVAVARFFQGSQSFLAKLDFALDLMPSETDAEWRGLLDELAAGCLDSSQLIMDLLGYQPNLAAALEALAELARGTGTTGASEGSLGKLRSSIAAGFLPLTAESIWDRILRELQRGRPLSRTDEKQEWALLMKLSERLTADCPAERKTPIGDAVRDRVRRLRDAALMRE